MVTVNLDQIKAEMVTRTLKIEIREAKKVEGEEDDRLVDVAFSSEEPCERYYGYEILDHGAKSVRLERLKDGAPVLLGHDSDDQVGVVENARIDGDRKGRAVLRFSRSGHADEILTDIRDGIRRKISVGYRVHSIVLEKSDESGDVYRVDDWEPFEISIVSIPADNVGAGVGRSINQEGEKMSGNKKVSEDPELYEVLWSDGILFTTKQIIYELNGFDESYFGDCEMQDFGYRLHFKGYTNLYWKSLFSSHKLIDYTSKSSNPKQLIDLAWKSRKLFKDTWNDIEYKTYNFKSNPC